MTRLFNSIRSIPMLTIIEVSLPNNLKEYKKALADYVRILQIDPNYTLAKDKRENSYRMPQGKS